MATTLKARICEDEAFILELIHSIWEETAEDNAKWEEYAISPLDLWVELYDPEFDIGVGAIRLKQWDCSSTVLKMCVQIFKEYRHLYSVHAPKAIHEWIFENVKNFDKVIAFIPDAFPNVQAFAEGAGWEPQGCITKGFTRQAKKYNINIYGKDIAEMRS